jgi:hypothetical protein
MANGKKTLQGDFMPKENSFKKKALMHDCRIIFHKLLHKYLGNINGGNDLFGKISSKSNQSFFCGNL